MKGFEDFINDNEVWFRGRLPETNESLNRVEKELEILLPEYIRWLLINFGYWHGTGIENIQESIKKTKQAREHLNLPKNYIVLYDHGDGGFILLDTLEDKKTNSHKVYNVGYDSIPDEMEDEIIFDSFIDYLKNHLENKKGFLCSWYLLGSWNFSTFL